MATAFCAQALEWWLRGQNKFVGAKVNTQETSPGSGQFVITQWDANGVAQPNDAAINQIISDYNADTSTKASDKASKKSSARTKLSVLGLTDTEIDELIN
jgi:hypothetical protein